MLKNALLMVLSAMLMCCTKDPLFPQSRLPVVSTTAIVTNAAASTAQSGGTVASSGGALILARGVCWSNSVNPTVDNNKTVEQGGEGAFISNLTNLTAATTYYIRAYATNEAGTAYGNPVSFLLVTTPTVVTSPVTNITASSAYCGGTVSASGGASVTERGVCWSNTTNTPTTFSSRVASGSGTGSYLCIMTGLSSGSIYYVRSYAVNTAGTSYGQSIQFKAN